MAHVNYTAVIVIGTFTVSTFYLVRMVLVVVGWLKEPVLRSFEKYGDEENLYYPLPNLLICVAAFCLSGSVVIGNYTGRVVLWPGIFFILMAYLARRFSYYAQRYPQIMLAFPRWYNDLRERTTRLERRRIAYMWRRLPWRTQLIYNSSTQAFNVWADFIIMGTVLEA
jgi:hypothetical protein